MNESLVQQPREIIFSQLKQHSIKIAKPTKFRNDLIKNRYYLPPIINQTQHKRTRTEPDASNNSDFYKTPFNKRELTKLKYAFSASGSEVLSHLSKKIDSLQSLQIITGGAVRNIKYSGHIKIPTVHNDYHNSKTNPGYSRNKFGGIYPK